MPKLGEDTHDTRGLVMLGVVYKKIPGLVRHVFITDEVRSKMTKLQDLVDVVCGTSSTMHPTFTRNGKLPLKNVGKMRARVAETQGKLRQALLVTVAMSDMAKIQEGCRRAGAKFWDSWRDLNQGTNLVIGSLENRLGSMGSVAVGTEVRDLNDITFLERSTNCLDHISPRESLEALIL